MLASNQSHHINAAQKDMDSFCMTPDYIETLMFQDMARKPALETSYFA